ncbi:MAG: hypothetical protein E7319_00440 [Clostridiales bacterium]|nr:hypothetical protein [Clostridiales bacterium]
MKEGKGSFLVALWWIIGCFCLGVLLLLLAPRQARMSTTENRMLAGAPEASLETLMNGEFFTDIEEYLCDSYFMRQEVIDATDELLGVFDRRTEDQRMIQEEARVNQLLTMDAQGASDQEDVLPPRNGDVPDALPTPTASLTPSPTATSTPAPTATPAVAPTPTPTAAPTATASPTVMPTDTATPATTPVSTATPAPTPYATHTPVPTATPKVIVPLTEGEEYGLWLLRGEDNPDRLYSYPSENIMNFAGTLNLLKSKLPEDGEIHYMQVPVASVGTRLCSRNSKYSGWLSTMEDALQSQVENNIFIHNIPAILNDPLSVNKETDLFYYTDHHWTPKGAWYALEAVMKSRGYPVVGFDEYEYQRRFMGESDNGRVDWTMPMDPLLPVKSVVLRNLTEETDCPFMYHQSTNYMVYLYGTHTPWRRFDTGYGTDRKALLICDSFGNVFLPYLLPYYDEVHMTDLRDSYYDAKEAGGTFSELVAYHQIDDIYIVLSTSNGINSSNSLRVFPATISQ